MTTELYSDDRRFNEVCKRLVRKGWRTVRSKKHVRLRHPEHKSVLTVPKTPSDGRAFLNWLSQLRRCGVDYE